VLDEAMGIERAVRRFEKKFLGLHGILIQLDEKAVNRLLEKVFTDNERVDILLEGLLKNYEHGLKLLREKTGKNSFVFSREAIESPQQYLSDLIKESYQQGA
jgi:ABC-type thiamine transport system substrate-binding protein